MGLTSNNYCIPLGVFDPSLENRRSITSVYECVFGLVKAHYVK